MPGFDFGRPFEWGCEVEDVLGDSRICASSIPSVMSIAAGRAVRDEDASFLTRVVSIVLKAARARLNGLDKLSSIADTAGGDVGMKFGSFSSIGLSSGVGVGGRDTKLAPLEGLRTGLLGPPKKFFSDV